MAKRWQPVPGYDQEDMVQIAMIGLIKAANSFDPSNGANFATYACRCIENELKIAYRDNHSRESASDVLDYLEAKSISSGHESNPEEAAILRQEIAATMQSINELTPRERRIVREIASGMTQKRCSRRHNLSQSYVSRIVRRCRQRLARKLDRR